MITVDTPASFEWTDLTQSWVKSYLLPKKNQIMALLDNVNINIETINENQFSQLCQILETTAEGRELRNKMFKAWRSKKSRDSDNGKKLYTFNLSIKAGQQLKKIAKSSPLNKTLESLIFSKTLSSDKINEHSKKLTELQNENTQLRKQLNDNISNIDTSIDEYADAILNKDLQVNDLAKLEKSQLIKKILILKRKLNDIK